MVQGKVRSIIVADKEITLVVKRRKVRHAYGSIGPDFCLRLVLPETAKITPEEILSRKRAWIEKKVRQLSEMDRVLAQDCVLIDGRPIRIKESPGRRSSVRLEGGMMHVRVPQGDSRERIVSERLVRMTEEILRKNLRRLARDVGVAYRSASVREMRRWGQCTRDGDLRFDSRLVCLPGEVARYVMLHELVHLVNFDHSARFRRLLGRHCPDYRELERRLKTYLK